MTIIFSALYVVAAILVHWLQLPPESEEIVAKGLSLNDLDADHLGATADRSAGGPEVKGSHVDL